MTDSATAYVVGAARENAARLIVGFHAFAMIARGEMERGVALIDAGCPEDARAVLHRAVMLLDRLPDPYKIDPDFKPWAPETSNQTGRLDMTTRQATAGDVLTMSRKLMETMAREFREVCADCIAAIDRGRPQDARELLATVAEKLVRPKAPPAH